MPIFKLNKLVRDKLPETYKSLGQKAKLRTLLIGEHKKALIDKIIEEAAELQGQDLKRQEIVSEIADVQQVLDDYKAIHGISDREVDAVKRTKHVKKGGFAQGVYIETLELAEGDDWIKYYRAEPDKYPEIE